MGVVYRAHQPSLDRRVALKMILFGPLASAEQIRRFRTEVSAAAALQHPNIVAVHEVGVHEGQHYLVMDLVGGPNLAGLVKDKPLPAKRAAGYLKSIAEAIHYAHEHGILHRDLKPSNVLVGSDDRPRVADFGLARRLGVDSSLTISGQMLGSPNYMPPEQAAVGRGKVGRAGDVYGLGAVLYHLLTARPPFQAETIPQTIQLVTSTEPLSPRALVPSVPRDLETICLKCLEKDPAKRYPTAQALVDELDRFLKGEPILARPVGPAGKIWRWCRRKPAVATAIGVALAALVAVAVVSSVSAVRTNRARQAERLEAYYSAIALADQYIQQGNIQGAKDLLFGCPAEFRHWEWGHLLYLCHQDVVSIATWKNEIPIDSSSQMSIVNSRTAVRLRWLSFSPDGSALITQGTDGSVKVWTVEDGRLRFAVGGPTQPVHWYTVDSLGHRLTTGGGDGTAQVFDLVNGREVSAVVHGPNIVCCTALSPGGRQLVTGGGGLVRVWDVERGECRRQWNIGEGSLERFELIEEGTRLLTKQGRRTTVWEVSSGSELERHEMPVKEGAVFSIEGVDGSLITFDTDNRAQLWRTNGTSTDLGLIRGSAWEIFRWAEFSVDGRLFCTGGDLGTARVWETDTGKERLTLPGRISGAEFSPAGTRLATVGADKAARIWDLGTGREIRTLRGHAALVELVRFSPDGRLVATADRDGVVKIWSSRNGREVLWGDSWTWGPCYSPDGKRVASVSSPVLDLRVWDADSGAELLRFRPGMEHACHAIRFSADGRFLATGGAGGDVRLWDSTTGKEIRRLRGHTELVMSLAFSPDGRHLAAGANDGTARLWEVGTGALLHVFTTPTRGITQVAFSPDGRRIYASGSDGYLRTWETQSGRLVTRAGFDQPTLGLFGLTPDGRRIYKADLLEDRLRVWDAATGRSLEAVPSPSRQGHFMAFTPDGRRLAMAVGTIREGYGGGEILTGIFDLERGREILTLRGHTEFDPPFQFDPQGRRLLSGGGDFTTRQWETFPWREGACVHRAD